MFFILQYRETLVVGWIVGEDFRLGKLPGKYKHGRADIGNDMIVMVTAVSKCYCALLKMAAKGKLYGLNSEGFANNSEITSTGTPSECLPSDFESENAFSVGNNLVNELWMETPSSKPVTRTFVPMKPAAVSIDNVKDNMTKRKFKPDQVCKTFGG